MHPKPEIIERFRRIYYDDFHEELTEEEATRMWHDLMDFMTLLFKKTAEEMRQSSSGSESVQRRSTD